MIKIAEGKIEGTFLGLFTDMLIDDELACSDVLNLTPIVLDESVTDQSPKKNYDLSVDYFYAVGLMSVYQRCQILLDSSGGKITSWIAG